MVSLDSFFKLLIAIANLFTALVNRKSRRENGETSESDS
jgi:hypothetical protein